MSAIRVLIFGDDPYIGKLNEIVLSQVGYRTLFAPTIPEGLKYFYQETPDLLVMQHSFVSNQLSTAAFYHKVRQNPATITLPIIVVRCEWPQQRMMYATHQDLALVMLPIIYQVEELTDTASQLLAARLPVQSS